MKPFLLSTLTLSLASAFAFAAEPSVPATPISGIDTQYIDPAVRAQDDFFTYLNGKWLKTTEIPADKSSWGTFVKLRDDTHPAAARHHRESPRPRKNPAGSDAQKIGDLYASYMDESALDAAGLQAAVGRAAAHPHALKDKKAVPALMAHLSQIGVTTPVRHLRGPGRHANRPTTPSSIRQSGLGMPDRDYYLKKDDAKLADALGQVRAARRPRCWRMAGDKDAAAKAKAIVAFETALAQVQWTKVENCATRSSATTRWTSPSWPR